MRGQKGITLVALVITIIVLLILAVVAITAITDTELVNKANDALTAHNNAVGEETNQMKNYANYINQYLK